MGGLAPDRRPGICAAPREFQLNLKYHGLLQRSICRTSHWYVQQSASVLAGESKPVYSGKNRFQAPQPPLFQPGIQVANVRPAGCPQAGEGDLSTNPFRNVLGTGTGVTKRSRAKRQVATEIEDCLVLKSVTCVQIGSIKFLHLSI